MILEASNILKSYFSFKNELRVLKGVDLTIKKGEIVIIAAFAWMNEREVKAHSPSVVFVDEHNRIRDKAGKLKAKPRLVSG